MQWYYCPDPEAEELQLPDDELHHLRHVLRAKTGDELIFTDGKGTLTRVEVVQTANRFSFRTLSTEVIENPFRPLHLALAPTKNIDRIEWLIEKSTELGLTEITPLICRHSERKEINEVRLNKLITSASKQSQRAHFLKLNKSTRFKDFIEANNSGWIAHCNNDFQRHPFTDFIQTKESLTVLVGPEGDFNAEEITFAYDHSYKGLNLGAQRLRTETAGLAVCLALLL